MWIPKVPRRWDFCGCPPCGLCFNWVAPRREPKTVKESDPIVCEEIVMDGLVKMTEDLLGKPAEQATLEEKAQVEKVALQIHERNIINAASGEGPKAPEGGATFEQEEENKWFEAAINRAGASRRAEKAYQGQVNKPKTLDQMDWGASEEAKNVEKEKEEKLKKEAEKQRMMEMPYAIKGSSEEVTIKGNYIEYFEKEQYIKEEKRRALERLREAEERLRYRR